MGYSQKSLPSFFIWDINKFSYLCARVSHIRPAPAKLPQGRKAARVCGCSGAIYQAYPFFVPISHTRHTPHLPRIPHLIFPKHTSLPPKYTSYLLKIRILPPRNTGAIEKGNLFWHQTIREQFEKLFYSPSA